VFERAGIGELLEPHALEDGTFGCPRVDCGDRVTGTREGLGQLPLPATHLQHPGRRVTDLGKDELLYLLLSPRGFTHGIGWASYVSLGVALLPIHRTSSYTWLTKASWKACLRDHCI
jgi:hypothetical protein